MVERLQNLYFVVQGLLGLLGAAFADGAATLLTLAVLAILSRCLRSARDFVISEEKLLLALVFASELLGGVGCEVRL